MEQARADGKAIVSPEPGVAPVGGWRVGELNRKLAAGTTAMAETCKAQIAMRIRANANGTP